jgi:VWFA-related protein
VITYVKFWAALLVLIALLVWQPAHAADPLNIQISGVEEQPGRLTATVSVFGADGRPITGLGTPNFSGSLNDTKLAVSDLLAPTAGRQPAHVVLLVDVSGSMAGAPIAQARAAMLEFVRGLDPGDRVSVITFGSRVSVVQDFTADRTVLNQSILRITVAGDTALYDGVLEGIRKISEVPGGRRMVVLLSDGDNATINTDLRAESLAVAQSSGVGIFALGLGTRFDPGYLEELARASGGRYVPAPTATALRQVYIDVAHAIRSQYTVVLAVPRNFDRTVPAKLTVNVSLRGDNALAERQLGPLAGAVVPPFSMSLEGLAANERLTEPRELSITPKVDQGVNITSVVYKLDDEETHTATEAPFAFSLDSKPLAPGTHILSAIATDARGQQGEAQVSFVVAAPAKSSFISAKTLLVLLVVVILAGVVVFILRRKQTHIQGVVGRLGPFARRSEEPFLQPIDGWPAPPQPAPKVVVQPEDRALGRIVVMDEEAVRGGQLDSIREYEIRTQPLTLGTSAACDIQLTDPQGRIAAEEARLWVQRRRLVYHKLTTLSAMATEGVTSGWEFLESGEEMRLGPYRILFEEYEADYRAPATTEETAAEPLRPVQEHGMSLSDLWTRVTEETGLRQTSD